VYKNNVKLINLTFIHCPDKQIIELTGNGTLKTITKMMIDALIKAGKPDTSCARACYVGR